MDLENAQGADTDLISWVILGHKGEIRLFVLLPRKKCGDTSDTGDGGGENLKT